MFSDPKFSKKSICGSFETPNCFYHGIFRVFRHFWRQKSKTGNFGYIFWAGNSYITTPLCSHCVRGLFEDNPCRRRHRDHTWLWGLWAQQAQKRQKTLFSSSKTLGAYKPGCKRKLEVSFGEKFGTGLFNNPAKGHCHNLEKHPFLVIWMRCGQFSRK